jgi:pyridoxamine 5'-phosphate oxidase
MGVASAAIVSVKDGMSAHPKGAGHERKAISSPGTNRRARFANRRAARGAGERHCKFMSASDPFALFDKWFDEARTTETDDPTAMALGTADASGRPSVRMVLLKAADRSGFVFYTNLDSPKATDLRANPRASLCLHWAKLEKQVRIDGPVVPVSEAEADAYFATRPRLSQLGAWASRQSEPMAGRFELEQAVAAVTLRFHVGRVPRPPNWSGFRVVPDRIEFWHQRPFRHHDRRIFLRAGDAWQQQWLFP